MSSFFGIVYLDTSLTLVPSGSTGSYGEALAQTCLSLYTPPNWQKIVPPPSQLPYPIGTESKLENRYRGVGEALKFNTLSKEQLSENQMLENNLANPNTDVSNVRYNIIRSQRIVRRILLLAMDA